MPIFFVSYARDDAVHPEYRDSLNKFVADLSAKVAEALPHVPLDEISFIDEDVQAGEVWSDEIAAALTGCAVGLALYTPRYFTRRWCGKEFQVLLNRKRPGQSKTGIVPVRWTKDVPSLPDCAARIQYTSGAFPAEYASLGMRQLVELRAVYPLQYRLALNELADSIVKEAEAQALRPLESIDFTSIESAWEAAAANDPQSHIEGNISKTCFVFVSSKGWDWVPYEGRPAEIGALAQKISGELSLKYEEIPCDVTLPQKLKEANDHNVPIVLFGDPTSLVAGFSAGAMQEYDAQYLLNCATLVPWEPGAKESIETDPRWLHLKTTLFKQKATNPPPYHEWRSVFSRDELDQKTRTLIEQIRSRLMKQLVSDPTAGRGPRKAEDAAISQNAAALGLNVTSLSQLEGPTQ